MTSSSEVVPQIEELRWHDGVIGAMKILGKAELNSDSALELSVSTYPPVDPQTAIDSARDRNCFTLKFGKLKQVNLSFDFEELEDNARAGNINSGNLESLPDGNRKFSLELFGGSFSLIFAHATVVAA
jgi:hypothetical protein